MDVEVLKRISKITDEEKQILDGKNKIDRDIYMLGNNNIINADKLVSPESLITIRTHTRFIHFPEHTHDFVEIVYMCSGETSHIVNEKHIKLKQGEFLFMNQRARHEVLRADEGDIAVNFITVPEFFMYSLSVIGEEETPLRRFLVDCLCENNGAPDFLHFRVSDIRTVQNLAENLIIAFADGMPFKRKTVQITMALLFLQLAAHTETLSCEDGRGDVVLKLLGYVEKNYSSANLKEASSILHYGSSYLSREIKNKTGKTFTELVQERRLAQAVFLLKNTDKKIDEISRDIGYENVSYFHRIFNSVYGKTPRSFRKECK